MIVGEEIRCCAADWCCVVCRSRRLLEQCFEFTCWRPLVDRAVGSVCAMAVDGRWVRCRSLGLLRGPGSCVFLCTAWPD